MRHQLTAFAALVALLGVGSTPTAAAQARCEAPQALIVIDKSSSMLGVLPEGITKWDAARGAIREMAVGYADTIDFGMQPFPFPDRCEPGRITIDVGDNDAETLLAGLGSPPPTGGNYTPMAATLDVAASYAPLRDPDRSSHVVLITDGWEWCDPYDAATRFNAVDSVARLTAMGVTVHIVGFGGSVDTLTLNRAAVAAGTELPGCDPTSTEPSDPNVCYQQADDFAGLRGVLDSIGRFITEEMCDGFDNDCDGLVDEGFDVDGDLHTVCGTDFGGTGVVNPDLADCDDHEPAVHPGHEEICDGLDNDCDGTVDPGCACTDGETRGCGTDVGACEIGVQTCEAGSWGACVGEVRPTFVEGCDGVDDDCDGFVDEDALCEDGMVCIDARCIDNREPPPEDPPPPPPEPEPEPEPEPVDPVGLDNPGAAGGACECSAFAGGRDASSGLLGLLVVGFLIGRRRR